MRALWLLAVAACTPDIVSGAYLCGPDQACPQGQACNGADNTCVDPSAVEPFACDPNSLHEPDDTPAQGFPVTGLTCVSTPVVVHGCLAAGDTANWITFSTPSNCATVGVQANVVFPTAWEPLALTTVALPAGTAVDGNSTCSSPALGGDAKSCLKATLTDGTTYALQVSPSGGGDCNGTCNYNHYDLTIQLVTP